MSKFTVESRGGSRNVEGRGT